MRYSMNINNFKKVISVATVFTIAACLVPKPAQAGYAKGSGDSGNSIKFSFNLNLAQNKNNEGFFPEAIQEFKVPPDNNFATSKLCDTNKVNFCNGDVKVTKLTEVNGKIPGLDFGLSVLDQILEDGISLISTRKSDRDIKSVKPDIFSNNVLRYDVTLDSDPDSELIWFIESNDSNLPNDLSGLGQFRRVLGIFPDEVRQPQQYEDQASREGSVFDISLQTVPEPTSTASVLSIGALGAVSLLKRKKPLKKTNGLNQ